eukprot:CAMPEP_0202871550 /NCGR_PEP_ID=MMETSP1391-20130828/19021_1 /ASSEMBLY_ACC=CAM_ASM_000867 /TAXON_ID=1034604 /ORGANISM="Chlamydomonas leiostraca, Strain SAG 11-49" /LENGTH=245 /DNA_ID=CAMNT_0049552385 /DNA_START=382 /DNA_END=1119 /DNA_ORIENTATION=+
MAAGLSRALLQSPGALPAPSVASNQLQAALKAAENALNSVWLQLVRLQQRASQAVGNRAGTVATQVPAAQTSASRPPAPAAPGAGQHMAQPLPPWQGQQPAGLAAADLAPPAAAGQRPPGSPPALPPPSMSPLAAGAGQGPAEPAVGAAGPVLTQPGSAPASAPAPAATSALAPAQAQSASGLQQQPVITTTGGPPGGISITTYTPVTVSNPIEMNTGNSGGGLSAVLDALVTRPRVVIVPVLLG